MNDEDRKIFLQIEEDDKSPLSRTHNIIRRRSESRVILYIYTVTILVKLRAHNTIELSIDSRNRNTFAVLLSTPSGFSLRF